ncbi:MAG: methionine biosynthesis protein MetW, partial [Xanthobacteraceae bacterium]
MLDQTDRKAAAIAANGAGNARVDLLLVAEMVAPGSRVLDVGCG